MARKSNSTIESELISEVKQCYEDGTSAEQENISRWVEDMNFAFVPGAQWDTNALQNRQGRPCYSYNRVVGPINQVVGDQRQSRPMAKVRPASKQASLKTADIYGGMIRNIESCSGAAGIYDQQYKYAVAGGYGAWRILSKFKDGDSFDQELEIAPIANPLNVFFDPTCTDPFKRGGMTCVIAERITRAQYKSQFPGFTPSNFDVSRDNRGWFTKDEVRVAEYFKRICKRKKIALLSDGRVVDDDEELAIVEGEAQRAIALGMENVVTVVDRRTAEDWSVKWWKVDGAQILEGPIEYKWKYIPVIRLPGRYVNIEGKQYLSSLIRFTKDSQRSYNYNRSTMVELVSLTPRAPYIGTSKMFKGYENQWNNANKANRPYLTYDIDPDAPNARPTREPPPDVPQALIALATQDAEDIRQTCGYYNPAMDAGEGGVESGRALIQQSRVGDSATYEFVDNLAKAIQLTAECVIDMIPTTYVGPQVVRILGEDGVEDYAEINQVGQDGLMNSLAEGKYDVTVTMGPAFATARQDALRTLMETITAMPIFGEIAPDLIAKNLDVEGGDELYKRMRKKLIQQGVVEPDEKEREEMGPPQEPQPDPVQVAMVNRLIAQTEKDQASTQKTQLETLTDAQAAREKPLEIEKLINDIVAQQLDNLLKARDLSMPHASVLAMQKRVESDAR